MISLCLIYHLVEMLYLNTIEQLFFFVEQLDQLEVCLPYSILLTSLLFLDRLMSGILKTKMSLSLLWPKCLTPSDIFATYRLGTKGWFNFTLINYKYVNIAWILRNQYIDWLNCIIDFQNSAHVQHNSSTVCMCW